MGKQIVSPKVAKEIETLNSKIRTIHPTTELGTMSDLVSLISESASGLFVNCRIGATIVNKLCGVSARQGTINAFKSNASSDYIEYTVIDTEAVVYSGFYKISTDTATYKQFAVKDDFNGFGTAITVPTGWNQYTCPADGYAILNSDQQANVVTMLAIKNNGDYLVASAQPGYTASVFLKKGMKIGRVGDSNTYTLTFLPLA